jgi:hypothetical protein
MFARTEADLEMEWAILAEQSRGGNFALRRHLDLWKQPLDQFLLALPQPVAA